MMNILALDLGTHTGWAMDTAAGLELGTWQLATPAEIKAWGKSRLSRRCDPRFARLFTHLHQLSGRFDVVVFEDVQFSSYMQQCQLWASFRAVVCMAMGSLALVESVPVGTLKKFATGMGNATKHDMLRAALNSMPDRFAPAPGHPDALLDRHTGLPLDDNAIDALHLLRWAKLNFRRFKSDGG